MQAILLPIKPEFAGKILTGEKMFEFRTRIGRKPVDKIYIYATVPVKRVVGEAIVEEILSGSPDDIWEQTRLQAGISEAFFRQYFCGRKVAFAYHLVEVFKYEHPLVLECFGMSKAPQSFAYVSEKIKLEDM